MINVYFNHFLIQQIFEAQWAFVLLRPNYMYSPALPILPISKLWKVPGPKIIIKSKNDFSQHWSITNCAFNVRSTALFEKLIHPKVKAINGLWSFCFLLMQQQLVMCNFCAPSKNLFAISECSKILLDELWKAVCAFGVCPKMCQGHPDTHKSQVPLEITISVKSLMVNVNLHFMHTFSGYP